MDDDKTSQSFRPLPEHPRAGRAQFYDCLADLFRTFKLDTPAQPAADDPRSWESRARAALREVCDTTTGLPEEAFDALMRAAVYDPDPSFDRQFVEPARDAFGLRRIRTALLEYLQHGTNAERAGAARAWYWARNSTAELRHRRERGLPDEPDDCRSVVAEWHATALREFVTNEDLDVRRCVLPGLSLRPSTYPPDLHRLLARAITIARSHPDDYIRHRIEIQLQN